MIIYKDHIRIIKIMEEEEKIEKIWGKLEVDKHHLTRRLTELMVMGLVDVIGKNAYLTKEGKMIYDAIHWVESNLGINLLERDLPKDQWINSQVINILKYHKETNYLPEEWRVILEERGLFSDSKVNQAADLILEAYRTSRPSLYIDSNIAEFLAAVPPGPADYKVLLRYRELHGYAENIIYALEAQRLLEVSPPYNGRVAYMLTPAGMRLKEYLGELPIFYTLMIINEKLRKLLEKKKETLTSEEKHELEKAGLYDLEANGYTEISKKLLEVYKLQTSEKRYIPPIYVTKNDIKLLNFIEETWKKYETNPEIFPHRKYIEEKLGDDPEKTGFNLNLLEARGFEKIVDIKGKETYELTENGKLILSYFKNLDTNIPTEAVKALTFREWGEMPSYNWIMLAEKSKLLGNGDFTKRGKVLLDIAKNTERRIYVTRYDALILTKVPSRKPITKKDLLEIMRDTYKKEKVTDEELNLAISEAETKGYIVEYPNEVLKLTELGEQLKIVIESAKTDVILSMKVSLTPSIIEILKTIKEHEPDYAKAWSEKEVLDKKVVETISRDLKLPFDTVKEAVAQLRGMGFLGRKAGGRILTGPAETLLKALTLI